MLKVQKKVQDTSCTEVNFCCLRKEGRKTFSNFIHSSGMIPGKEGGIPPETDTETFSYTKV